MDGAGYAVGGALAALAHLRGGKAVHPHGAAHEGRLVIDGAPGAPAASSLLSTPAEHRAVVRFSRSLGLPRPLPDLLGVALRVLDAYGPGRHQDLLMVSSADYPVVHHVFLPAGDVQQRPYSSSLPYRAGDRTFIVGVRPVAGSPRPEGGDELDRLDRAARTGDLRFELVIAAPFGRFARVGVLHVGARLDGGLDALRFNPFNSGGGLEPVGALNRLRDYAYPLSQRAWAATGGRREDQRRAEAELDALAARETVRA